MSLTEQRKAAATAYATALNQFVAAYARLAALDRALNAPSFGLPPDVISFRHPTATPEFSVDVYDEINRQHASLRR